MQTYNKTINPENPHLLEKESLLKELQLSKATIQEQMVQAQLRILAEKEKASIYNEKMNQILLEQNLFSELSNIAQSQLSTTDRFTDINQLKKFLQKDLIKPVVDYLSADKINIYIQTIDSLTNHLPKTYFNTNFELKVQAFQSLLTCKNLNTQHLNQMALSLLCSPIYKKRNYANAIIDENCQKTIDKIFYHNLFSNHNNSKDLTKIYTSFVANVTDKKRKYTLLMRLNTVKLNNRNYKNYINSNAIKPILNQIQSENIIFDLFLKNNIHFVETYLVNHQNTLTYLVDKTKGKFAYQELIGTYLKYSKKYINELDINGKTPIQYAKSNTNFFFYESNPIYLALVKGGATPIKNHSLDLIKKTGNLLKNNQKEDVLTLNEEQFKKEKQSNEFEIMYQKMSQNIQEIKKGVSALNLIQESALFTMLDNVLSVSHEVINQDNKLNMDENYLFIKEATLNYLPQFTKDFLEGINVAPLNEKELFIQEYCNQLSLIHQKTIENYEQLIKNNTESKLETMKKNTAFINAKI